MPGKAILVVDDDASTREMVRSILQREGFDVDDAASGDAALACIEEKDYAGIVLDVMMSNGNGHDVLRSLAATRPDVKCVVVISAASVKNIEEVAEANVVAKLRKPFNIAELVEAVHHCVAG